MTSKLDTAGLVERLRPFVRRNEDGSFVAPRDADLCSLLDWAEALTQAAAPDMEPVMQRWRGPRGGWIAGDARLSHPWPTEPLYSASQLSAVQGERDALETLCDQRFNEIAALGTRLEAAEARVAELLAQINGGGNDASSS